jgi:hypothetical protein
MVDTCRTKIGIRARKQLTIRITQTRYLNTHSIPIPVVQHRHYRKTVRSIGAFLSFATIGPINAETDFPSRSTDTPTLSSCR